MYVLYFSVHTELKSSSKLFQCPFLISIFVYCRYSIRMIDSTLLYYEFYVDRLSSAKAIADSSSIE